MSNKISGINMNITDSANIHSKPDNSAASIKTNNISNKSDDVYQKQLKPEQISNIVKTINNNIQSLNQKVNFSYNKSIKSLVVNVVDSKTGDVIRQIPPKDVVNLQKKMSEVIGLIFDHKGV